MNPKFYWVERIAAVLSAIILIQTLYFKFTAHPESVYIFSTLGVEPWGRIVAGVMELAAGILLLYPRTSVWGAFLGAGAVGGAILSHLLWLGIAVGDDGGQLFMLAVLTLLACSLILFLKRTELFQLISRKK